MFTVITQLYKDLSVACSYLCTKLHCVAPEIHTPYGREIFSKTPYSFGNSNQASCSSINLLVSWNIYTQKGMEIPGGGGEGGEHGYFLALHIQT